MGVEGFQSHALFIFLFKNSRIYMYIKGQLEMTCPWYFCSFWVNILSNINKNSSSSTFKFTEICAIFRKKAQPADKFGLAHCTPRPLYFYKVNAFKILSQALSLFPTASFSSSYKVTLPICKKRKGKCTLFFSSFLCLVGVFLFTNLQKEERQKCPIFFLFFVLLCVSLSLLYPSLWSKAHQKFWQTWRQTDSQTG